MRSDGSSATCVPSCKSEFKPRSQQFMNGAFPWQNIKKFGEMGILGMAVPKAYGGMELGVFDTALVLEEIAKGCYVTAMAVLGEVGSQTRIIATYGSAAVKQRLLPGVAKGEHLLSICMTEPHAGTDVSGLHDQCRAARRQARPQRYEVSCEPRRRGERFRGVRAHRRRARA